MIIKEKRAPCGTVSNLAFDVLAGCDLDSAMGLPIPYFRHCGERQKSTRRGLFSFHRISFSYRVARSTHERSLRASVLRCANVSLTVWRNYGMRVHSLSRCTSAQIAILMKNQTKIPTKKRGIELPSWLHEAFPRIASAAGYKIKAAHEEATMEWVRKQMRESVVVRALIDELSRESADVARAFGVEADRKGGAR